MLNDTASQQPAGNLTSSAVFAGKYRLHVKPSLPEARFQASRSWEAKKKRFVFDPPRQKHGFYINIRGRTRRGNNIRAVISHRAQRKGPSPASEANAATTLASRLSNIEECCCCKLLWCLWDFIPCPESKLWCQGLQQQDIYSFPLPAVSKPWEWLSDEPARVFTWIDSRHLLIR